MPDTERRSRWSDQARFGRDWRRSTKPETDRSSWLQAYAAGIAPSGIKLEGGEALAYGDGGTGFAVDTATWVLPNGARLPTRLTAVLSEQGAAWKVVHMHFSVGVPDEQAMEMAAGG